MKKQHQSGLRSVRQALATTRMEGLEPSKEAISLVVQAKRGKITGAEAIQQIISKHTKVA